MNQRPLNFTFAQAQQAPPRLIRELPLSEQPLQRLYRAGVDRISPAELIASILQTKNGLEIAHQLLHLVEGQLHRLPQLTRAQLMQLSGVGQAQAARLQASLELGRRVLQADTGEQPLIHSPADAANLLMYEMLNLTQEHLRIILLNTRNRVIAVPTVYVGSLNTSVVRVAELFKPAIVHNAAAVIVVHNHPSGDCSPSPEDVGVTRHLVQAGEMLSIPVLDHIILGRHRFVSLKERQLGFD
ncbi:MAG: DNA repair protein RadC [Anaerolineaceae bacterium]|nr:DNA repair protein RadC [Anaerolineaceae bacterium]